MTGSISLLCSVVVLNLSLFHCVFFVSLPLAAAGWMVDRRTCKRVARGANERGARVAALEKPPHKCQLFPIIFKLVSSCNDHCNNGDGSRRRRLRRSSMFHEKPWLRSILLRVWFLRVYPCLVFTLRKANKLL